MRKDKKAMAALIDAFMFITIIGLIAAGMFAYSNAAVQKETVAKTMHDTFFSIELRTNDIFDDTDTQSVRMCDLVAAYMVTGEGGTREYIENVLGSIIPPIYGYMMIFEYKGHTMIIGGIGNKLSSQYSGEMTILDGNIMRATLSLY
ncbi:MAG: hypothetical protein LBE47_00510 [Methanomassiliicoccaceae archaeon]|jgi:hypothetical protein|nr:hypothetical protein [Methanomassiliicoccaceae archaeon]